MAKAQKERNTINEESDTLNKTSQELSDEELMQVTGGIGNSGSFDPCDDCNCFVAIDPNFGKTHANCQQFNKTANTCKHILDLF